MRAWHGLLAAAAAGVLVGPLLASQAQADYDLAVTWPEATALNPAAVPYVISVIDSGPGRLQAVWGDIEFPLEHVGSAAMPATEAFAGTHSVEIQRCSPECVTVAMSPTPVTMATNYLQNFPAGQPTYVGRTAVTAPLEIAIATGPVQIDWRLVTDESSATPGVTMASGSQVVDLPSTLQSTLTGVTFSVPESVPEGPYRLLADVAMIDGGAFAGTLASSIPYLDWGARVFVDRTAPTDVEFQVSGGEYEFRGVFYPYKDDYLDRLDISVLAPYPDSYYASTFVSVTGPDGSVVVPRRPGLLSWDGRDQVGDLLPEGSYVVSGEVVDRAGNSFTKTMTVFISHAHRRFHRLVKVVSAQETVSRKIVGVCSKLANPSTHGWSGSLGYLSQVSCRRPGASTVATISRLTVPVANRGYGSLKIALYGGKAKVPGRAYIKMGYYRGHTERVDSWAQMSAPVAWHNGIQVSAASYVRNASSAAPYLQWITGLTDGARYDVKSFRVTLTYSTFD